MTVVMLSYAYPPMKSPRSVQVARLVKYLRAGAVELFRGDDPGPRDPTPLEGLLPDAANVRTIPWSPAARLRRRAGYRLLRGRWFVPDDTRPWVPGAVRALRARGLADGDALVTFGQPMSDHVVGLRALRHARVPWVAHFSDPWTDNAYRSDHPLERAANLRLERAVIERADRVVFTSAQTADLVMGKYERSWRDKVAVIPHAFDPELYPDAAPDGNMRVVRYIGNFYGHRRPEPLLEALALLQQDGGLQDARVELIGSWESEPRIPAKFHSLPVTATPAVDYTDSLALMRSADLLLVIDAPAESSVFLPSKLVDYVGAARPILGITPPGPAAELIELLGGHVAAPDDVPGIARALRSALSEPRRETWGEPAVRARYEARTVAAQLETVLERLAQDRA